MTQQQNEAEILFPDQQLNINGETITVNEFSFLQGMQNNAIAQPLIKDIGDCFANSDNVGFVELAELFAQHNEAMVQLIAVSINKGKAFVESLSDTHGQLLLMTFWSVNKDFFINRLMLVQQAKTLASSASPTPSTH